MPDLQAQCVDQRGGSHIHQPGPGHLAPHGSPAVRLCKLIRGTLQAVGEVGEKLKIVLDGVPAGLRLLMV